MLTFLSTPYSDPNPAVVQWRFNKTCALAAKLMSEGMFILSPIAHTHPIVLAGKLPSSMTYWKAYIFELLSKCDELLVVEFPGWENSVGVAQEIIMADNLDIPVRYMKWEE